MAELKPVTVNDLNGVSLNPQDLCSDELVGYVSYIRNLATGLGTKEGDTAEGYNDWLDFQKEIDNAQISTFTPDAIDDDHQFENVDLTGESDEVASFPINMFAFVNGMLLMAYSANGGAGLTPFDINRNEKYAYNPDSGLTPYDMVGNKSLVKSSEDEVVLTA